MLKRFLSVLVILSLFLLLVVACEKEKEQPTGPQQETEEIVGTWLSAGLNVAPLLFQTLGVDSLWATFTSDGTYHVVSQDTAGVQVLYDGTYVTSESSVSGIRNITLNQTTPFTATAKGIYQIFEAQPADSMKYEVVQTEPSLGVTPPTAEGGFGSSGGGAFGTALVQKYIRLQ